jgi:hypothetical protein
MGKVRNNKKRIIQHIGDLIIGLLGLVIVFLILISKIKL